MRKCGVEGVEGAVEICGLKHISDFNCYPPHRLHATCTATCLHAFYVDVYTCKWLQSNAHPSDLELVEGLSPTVNKVAACTLLVAHKILH